MTTTTDQAHTARSARPAQGSPRDEDGTLREACYECGTQISDDQDTYIYRITDIDGWTLYESICPACDRAQGATGRPQ